LRTAILTDIHGNLAALQKVVARCRELAVDRYVCLGDTVGYGAQPNACCDLVRELAAFSLLGNHDAAVAGRMRYDDYYDSARAALDWTRDVLSTANQAWLHSLPYTTREGAVSYCHGSPLEPEQFDYIFQPEHARELLPMINELPELTLIGHSHLPRAFTVGKNKVKTVPTSELALRADQKLLVSVGSVGQPRDGDPRACFAILDDETRVLSNQRIAYEIEKTASEIISAGLPVHFARRLFAGV
jgi:diadenosine tetraphosphatase ApaH/serine/threonine PP2A family protein phosphatase